MTIKWLKWMPFQHWRIVDTVESADEIPDKLPHKGAALVASQGRSKWIAFDCPCGTGHRILLNMDESRYPSWRARKNLRKGLTISPSIDYRAVERRCHYFIRNGKTVWAKEHD